MTVLTRLRNRYVEFIEVDLARDEMEHHCPHSPLGSCGQPECDDQVTADSYN